MATVAEMRRLSRSWHKRGLSLGLVPTMGSLHEGHLSLVRAANRENDRTVVSVFVNPIQFGPEEDFERYPRDLDADLARLASGGAGADAVYAPSVAEMYPQGGLPATRVRVEGVSEPLEGARRPGHFEGVATVVTKLLNAVSPDRVYLGQKDAQQVAVVSRLAADLDTGVLIRVCPIVREPDGLALSSRNAYLGSEERRAATCLFRALGAAARLHREGERSPSRLQEAMLEVLASEPLAEVDYAQLVNPSTFTPPGELAVLAVRIGRTRLIDNHLMGLPLDLPAAP